MAPPASTSYLLDLSHRGFIEGLTYTSASSDPLCHFFGGIPYALPPIGPFRWRTPRPLPACYRYGTRANPGRFTGGATLCPQPGYRGPPPQSDEDCLQLNVWVPVGWPPAGGWPVLFLIHGGWLQFGTPNMYDLCALLGETPCQCVVVCPAYRLNMFGFLACRELKEEAEASGEPFGNYGFWDQRLALEWTHKNICYFGGDAGNITVGGYSAGAHSAFHQLAHDLFHPLPSHHIIRRCIMFSNSPGMQPKPLSSAQTQFTSLLTSLSIPLSLSTSQKLSLLRSLPASHLLTAASTLSLHEFRATTDGTFIPATLFSTIDSGHFAHLLLSRNIPILMSECASEHHVYSTWRPPLSNSLPALQLRLEADYPASAVAAVLRECSNPSSQTPQTSSLSSLPTISPTTSASTTSSPPSPTTTIPPFAFGQIYAALQIHALQRGFTSSLHNSQAGHLLHRYRIEWRASCCDALVPREWGATHGTDLAIWFFGNGIGGVGLTREEKKVVKRFAGPVWRFMMGDMDVNGQGEAGAKMVRRLRADGVADWWEDEEWEQGVRVWEVVREAQRRDEDERRSQGAKL